MAVRNFGWFPVTVERPQQGTLYILHAARYDDVEREVAVDDDYQARFFGVDQITALNDQEFRFTTEYGEPIVIRPTRPSDAASWDRVSARIDLPIEVIGAIMTFNTDDPTIAAAVDDTGDVHTMILQSGVGLYARYARTWIRMTDITPIEQLDIVDVPFDDLEHYDQADDRGATVNVRDLNPLERPSISATSTTTPAPPVTAAAVAGTVVVNSPADLPDAIAFAATASGEGARWYVTRRAKALGWAEPLPWEDES